MSVQVRQFQPCMLLTLKKTWEEFSQFEWENCDDSKSIAETTTKMVRLKSTANKDNVYNK